MSDPTPYFAIEPGARGHIACGDFENAVWRGLMAQQMPNVQDILRTPYRIDIHQPVYFVLDDVDDLF